MDDSGRTLLRGVKTSLQIFDVLVPGCVQTACSVV